MNKRGMTGVRTVVNSVKPLYKDWGFTIQGFQGDNEFRPLVEYYTPIPVHTMAVNEHNGVIERSV